MSTAAYRDAPTSPMPLVVAFGGRVFGLDPHTGERRWRVDFGTPYATVRLAPVDETAMIVRSGAVLALITTATGDIVWRRDLKMLDGFMVAPPYVFVGGSGEVHCHALHDGSLVWAEEFKGEGLGEVSLALGHRVTQVDRVG